MTDKIEIRVVDRTGAESPVEWEPGRSLMETLRDNDFPILASCGGTASCATCHVYLDPEQVARLGERNDDEIELLEEADNFDPERSRLSCQIQPDEELDQTTVTIAPE